MLTSIAMLVQSGVAGRRLVSHHAILHHPKLEKLLPSALWWQGRLMNQWLCSAYLALWCMRRCPSIDVNKREDTEGPFDELQLETRKIERAHNTNVSC